MEKIFRRTWISHEDIKDFIAGPAYYAWAYMANLSGFGGPVHDSWFEERTELARKNQLIMRKLECSLYCKVTAEWFRQIFTIMTKMQK